MSTQFDLKKFLTKSKIYFGKVRGVGAYYYNKNNNLQSP